MERKDLLVLFGPLLLGMSSGLVIAKSKIPPVKSKYNPPPIVFSIVWPILYMILGYASYKINSIAKTTQTPEEDKDKIYENTEAKTAIRLFYIHLAGLIIWWPLFVYFPNKNIALGSLLVLAFSAIYIARLFYGLDRTSGLILTPYIMWLCVASFLTANT